MISQIYFIYGKYATNCSWKQQAYLVDKATSVAARARRVCVVLLERHVQTAVARQRALLITQRAGVAQTGPNPSLAPVGGRAGQTRLARLRATREDKAVAKLDNDSITSETNADDVI